MRQHVSAALLLWLAGIVVGMAQTAVPAGDDSMANPNNGQLMERLGGKPLTLTGQGAGAPAGKVWLASTPSGLAIFGEVKVADPQFAVGRGDLLAKDHVEVWLADGSDPQLPPVGWGNQFGQTPLASKANCSALSDDMVTDAKGDAAKRCAAWYDAQLSYRASLLRMFARQWIFSGG